MGKYSGMCNRQRGWPGQSFLALCLLTIKQRKEICSSEKQKGMSKPLDTSRSRRPNSVTGR